jgi:hypothetical protein
MVKMKPVEKMFLKYYGKKQNFASNLPIKILNFFKTHLIHLYKILLKGTPETSFLQSNC